MPHRSPALVKCGWGLERNRNGGSAAAAILALPAVAGKFGVRGGGYSMSNSASWNIERTWLRDPEPPTRAINMNHLGRVLAGEGLGRRSADQAALRLQLQSCRHAAGSDARAQGARARRSVHRRLRSGVHRHRALRRRRAAGDDVSRALRLREDRTGRSRCSWPGP